MNFCEFRNCSVDIGLENVAMAAARVVELPSRCNKKVCHFGRCLQNQCKTHYLRGRRSRGMQVTWRLGTPLYTRQKPIEQDLFWE